MLYIANTCTSTQVANSDYAASNSIFGTTGQEVVVTCNAGYSGSGTATCSTSGTFNAVSCTGTQAKVNKPHAFVLFFLASVAGFCVIK